MKDADALNAMKARLEANKIEVVGITDHEFVHSIYFFDPNGVRLEFTTQVVSDNEPERKLDHDLPPDERREQSRAG